MLTAGRNTWSAGDRIRAYRTRSGSAGLIDEDGDVDARDYDVEYYARLLRNTFAARLERAFARGDFEAVFADPVQMSLFAPPFSEIRTVLTPANSEVLAPPGAAE